MTPKRDEKFEDKLEAAATSHANFVSEPELAEWHGRYSSYKQAARWACEQTIKEVLEALRSEEAQDALTRGFGFARPSSVADWLEQRFKATERKMNDTNKGGTKHDQDKAPITLIGSDWIIGVAKILQFGAAKYGRHNWRQGITQSRLLDAAFRHLLAYSKGEDTDPESGQSHLLHASCCLMMAYETQLTKPELDDRFKIVNGDKKNDVK